MWSSIGNDTVEQASLENIRLACEISFVFHRRTEICTVMWVRQFSQGRGLAAENLVEARPRQVA